MKCEDLFHILNRVGDCDKVSSHCKVKNIAIQAGGHHGHYPNRLSQHFDKVYTFEADPANYAILDKTITSDKIIKSNAILGSAPGYAGLKTVPYHTGQGYVVPDGNIPVVTIDSLNLPSCDLIYLDIEGYELKALMGGFETISKFYPILAIEQKGMIGRRGYGDNCELREFLQRNNYRRIAKYNLDRVYARFEDK